MAGRVEDEEVHPERLGGEELVLELRTFFTHGAVLGVMDARGGTGVLRIDAEANLALVVRVRLGDDLDGGAFLLGLFGDVAVAEVFPEAAIAGDGFERVESLGRQPRHASLFGVTVGHVGPAGLVLILGPEEVLGFVADGVEVLLHVEIEFEGIRGEGFLDLRLAIEGLGLVSAGVEWLAGELRGLARPLDGEEDFVEQVQDGGVEVLLVGLLFLFQFVALRVTLGDAPIGFLHGVNLARGFLDAAHRGLVAGEHAEVVLLAEAVEKLLHFLGRDFGVRADDEEDAMLAHLVGDVLQLRKRQDFFVSGFARGLEHLAQAMADKVVHLVLRRIVREALEQLGEVLLPVEIVTALGRVVDIPRVFLKLLERFEKLGWLAQW